MTNTAFPPLDVTAHWGRLNDTVIALIDCIPDDRMDWSPKPELWTFRGILLHTIWARDNWLRDVVKDSAKAPNVLQTAKSKKDIRRELRRSWERVRSFLSAPGRLGEEYEAWDRGRVTGHWIAFHLLEHDIHHRADIFHYLALLGIEHPSVGTP